MTATLLTYAIQTTPDPLQVSATDDDPSLATLMIIVSNQTHKLIDCQSISFSFIQGANAKDFFSDSTGIKASPPTGWSIASDGALFTATPDTSKDGKIGADGLTFTLSNIKVNEQVGTTEMTVTEVTSSNTGTLLVDLDKFPPQFYVGDLSADPDTINQGESTLLTWSGSNATYELHYTDANEHLVTITQTNSDPPEPLPSTGSYTIDDLQKGTTFYLVVTLAVEGQDEPLKVKRDFTVTVNIPDVKINSFTVQPSIIYYAPGSTPPATSVTLSWDVVSASQILLDGNIVEGNSTVVSVNSDTTFTLEATGNPWPVYAPAKVTFIERAPPQISVPSGNSIEVTFYANPGTYTVDWSVDWETGETAGTATNSMTVTSSGGPETVVWNNVPMDMPPPYGGIVAARCTITGFPEGPINLQWQMS